MEDTEALAKLTGVERNKAMFGLPEGLRNTYVLDRSSAVSFFLESAL